LPDAASLTLLRFVSVSLHLLAFGRD